MTLRRSVLYVPGSNAKALEKVRALPCDGIIFDLEDAVAPDAKVEARQNVLKALELDHGPRSSSSSEAVGQKELIVRVNALESEWGEEDLKALAKSRAHAVLLPKVNGPGDIRAAEAILPAALPIWAMMETPKAILFAREIAAANIKGMVMGTSDLAKDLHAAHTPDRAPLLFALSTCITAARAYNLAILDGVHLDIEDEAGFAAACRQSVELGFDGRTLIHPKTIEAANTAFTPTAAAVAAAEKIIAAHKQAQAEGKAVVVVDGKLVEFLHVREAERLLALAQSIRERS